MQRPHLESQGQALQPFWPSLKDFLKVMQMQFPHFFGVGAEEIEENFWVDFCQLFEELRKLVLPLDDLASFEKFQEYF